MKTNWSVFPNLQVLDSAQSFYEAAEILDRENANALPIINLRCHAIELFLKSLYLTDRATDVGDGVMLLQPNSGRGGGHDLRGLFGKALQAHQEDILRDFDDFDASLSALDGVFSQSRYIYETGNSLPFGTARRVVKHLAVTVPSLERLSFPRTD